jgi:hypothetical protein
MTRVKRPLGLKIWAMKIAKRSGTNKARIALARRYGELALRGEGADYSAGSRWAVEGDLGKPVVNIGEPALRAG